MSQPFLNTRRSRSLQWRILLPLAGLTAITVGIGLFLLQSFAENDYRSEITKRAATIANSIVYATETAASFEDVQRFVATTGGHPDVQLILVAIGNPARIVASTSQEWLNTPLDAFPDPQIRGAIEGTLLHKSGPVSTAEERTSFIYVTPVRTGLTSAVPGRLQEGVVLLSFDNRTYLMEGQRRHRAIGWLLGLCIAGIAMSAWLLIRYQILSPISDIQRTMQFRAMGNSSAYAPFLLDGEVGDLARTFNEMLATLHESEQQLRNAHDNFTAFFNLSVDFLCVLDSTGAFIQANTTMLTRLGYSLDELRGQSVLVTHPPNRHAEAGRIVQEMLAGTADACRIPLQTKDGRLIPVETRIVKGVWDGKPALFGISKDISALVISEERFSKAFHSGAVMMAISTLKDGRYIDVNEAFLEQLKFAREDVIGHTSQELALLRNPETRPSLVSNLALTGRIRNKEIEVQTRTGELRYGLFSMDTVEMGDEACLLTTMVDITDRKRSELELEECRRSLEQKVEERTSALRESERLYRTLFEHTGQGVVYQDHKGRVTMANPAAERILGMPLPPSQTLNFADTQWKAIRENGAPFPKQDHPAMMAMKTGRSIPSVVMGILNAESNIREWILVDAFPEFQSGETTPSRTFMTITDITERKQIESQLFQAQKLESVGRLAAGVAHDFNNSLYCILGFSELIMSSLSPASEHRPYLTQIQMAAQQASEVAKQLLAFSRRQVLQPRPADINSLINSQQKMLHRLIGEDIQITCAFHPGCAIAIVDPPQFQQVLMNLCVNARDAMPQGGLLTIETDILDHVVPPADTEIAEGAFVRMVVADTGTGMTEETLDRIFEPFFTTKGAGKGTGLGLPVIHGIVHQHGGWIEVKSRIGFGSRFSVYLPHAGVDTCVASEEDAPAAPHGNSEGILIVEDDDVVRFLVTQILRNLGYRVIESASCAQAKERFLVEPQAVDLLLVDVVLADGTGTELAKELTGLYPSLKVVVTTGYTDAKSCHDEIRGRHWAFIQKPHSMRELATLLHSLLSPAPLPPSC